MRSFAGVVQEIGSEPGVPLLRHLGAAIRLAASSHPVIERDQSWGVTVVAHLRGDESLVARDGNASLAGEIRLDDRGSLACALGDSAHTTSDYDLTLRAWRRWGSSFVDHLFGDYSFVIWDGNAQELLCVRDRFGVRPFYYARIGRGLTFSDSLAAILAHPETESDALHDGAVADYLLHGVSDDAAATIYKDIRRLPPGHMLVHHPGGEISVRPYWQPHEAVAEPSRGDAGPQLVSALEQAIADRVAGASSAVVFMSGGLDFDDTRGAGSRGDAAAPDHRSDHGLPHKNCRRRGAIRRRGRALHRHPHPLFSAR
jgi:asparagine synthase (glutamine-hydrolysing)